MEKFYRKVLWLSLALGLLALVSTTTAHAKRYQYHFRGKNLCSNQNADIYFNVNNDNTVAGYISVEPVCNPHNVYLFGSTVHFTARIRGRNTSFPVARGRYKALDTDACTGTPVRKLKGPFTMQYSPYRGLTVKLRNCRYTFGHPKRNPLR